MGEDLGRIVEVSATHYNHISAALTQDSRCYMVRFLVLNLLKNKYITFKSVGPVSRPECGIPHRNSVHIFAWCLRLLRHTLRYFHSHGDRGYQWTECLWLPEAGLWWLPYFWREIPGENRKMEFLWQDCKMNCEQVESREIHAHKAVLKIRCEHFRCQSIPMGCQLFLWEAV